MAVTINADICGFEVHFEAVVARTDVVEVLIINTHRALRPTRTLAANSVKGVRETAQISRILHDGLQRRFFFHTSTDLHSTVASTQHHDYVITMATWPKVFTITNFVSIIAACI